MKKVRILASILFTLMIVMCSISSEPVCAGTFCLDFKGNLFHRVLDGSKNGKYYALYGGKKVSVIGTAEVTKDPNDSIEWKNTKGNAVEAGLYWASPSGKNPSICKTKFEVDKYDGIVSFSMTGKTEKSGAKYYLCFFKTEDDYIDLSLKGVIKSTN